MSKPHPPKANHLKKKCDYCGSKHQVQLPFEEAATGQTRANLIRVSLCLDCYELAEEYYQYQERKFNLFRKPPAPPHITDFVKV